MAGNDLMPEPTAPTGTGPRESAVSPGIDYRRLQPQTELMAPWRIPYSGKEQEAEALSQAFKAFSKGANTLGEEVGKQQGKEAGAAAGVSDAFQPKTGLAALTAYGDAFNAAAHVTYVTKAQTNAELAVAAAEEAHPRDPVAYSQQVAAVKEGILKQTPALYAPEMSNMLDRRAAAGYIRVSEQTIKGNQADAKQGYEETIETRLQAAVRTAADLPQDQATATIQQAIHDDKTMRDALVQSGVYSQAHSDNMGVKNQQIIEEMVHKNYADKISNSFMDVARAGDVSAADKALKAYVSDPKNSEADKEAVTKRYMEESDKYTALQSRVYAPQVAALAQRLANDEGGPAIEHAYYNMFKLGAVSHQELKAALVESVRNQKKGVEDDSSMAAVEHAVNGGLKLDPKNTEQIAAVDKYFNAQLKLNGVTPEDDRYWVSAAQLVHQTGIVPPSLQSATRSRVLDQDHPDQAIHAALGAMKIHEVNPQTDVYENDKLTAFTQMLVQNHRDGLSDAKAWQNALANISRSKEDQEQIKENYKAVAKPGVNTKALQDLITSENHPHWYSGILPQSVGGAPSTPSAPVPLQAEYERSVREAYASTNDIKMAQDLAGKKVMQTWGQTLVNSPDGKTPVLTKYPIEQMYHIPAPVVRADIAASLKDAGHTEDPADVKLMPNAQTDQTQGKVWSMVHVDPKTGDQDVLLDKRNQPLLYMIPTNTKAFDDTRRAVADQKLTEARIQRRSVQAGMEDIHPFVKSVADSVLGQ
jgi:hypothetical protein